MEEKKFNILIVDDDLKNIQVGINFLKRNEDYHLVFATSGLQALERVKTQSFDLILLDIMMPDMDGFEVCRKLKRNEFTEDIPVLFLTAKQDPEDLIRGFDVGGADYIKKPFNSHELLARVKTHIELHYQHKKEIERLQNLLFQSEKAEKMRFQTKGITHDCNNFLNAVAPNIHKIKTEILNKNFNIDDYEEAFQGIVAAVSKTAMLLRKFSDFGEDKTNIRDIVDMNTVVSDLIKIYKPSIENNIDLNIEFLDKPARTCADIIHIEQVLLNLIINAEHAIVSKHMENGERGLISMTISRIPGEVDSELKKQSIYIKISIEDNGIGMDQETVEKIFEPYFSTRKQEGGSGLGLAVSESIIKEYDGIIRATSRYGEGSCFSIYLPYCD